MSTRRFGDTGYMLPVVSCGGMRHASVEDLQTIVDSAMERGINHFETAAMYMRGRSESDYGVVLKKHPRESYILQTKVAPLSDPEEFRAKMEASFERLQIDKIDLFAFHGLNNAAQLAMVLKGGCLEVAQELKAQGRIGAIGFSTHAPTPLIVEAIESGVFEYVNLHYHVIGSYTSTGTAADGVADARYNGNLAAIEAAERRGMGIFIISPFDKGGKLFDAAPTPFSEAIAKASSSRLNAMHYAALWLWRRPGIHTISVGARTPTDFDNHIAAAQLLPDADGDGDVSVDALEGQLAPLLDPIDAAVAELQRSAGLEDDGWLATWWHGLPNALDPDADGANLPHLLFLYNCLVGLGLEAYSRDRFRSLQYNEKHAERLGVVSGDHWTPGLPVVHGDMDESAVESAIEARYGPLFPAEYAHKERALRALAFVHSALGRGE